MEFDIINKLVENYKDGITSVYYDFKTKESLWTQWSEVFHIGEKLKQEIDMCSGLSYNLLFFMFPIELDKGNELINILKEKGENDTVNLDVEVKHKIEMTNNTFMLICMDTAQVFFAFFLVQDNEILDYTTGYSMVPGVIT